MHAPLEVRPSPVPRETLPSFLSRLAAVNGVGATDFAVDLGFSIKRLLTLEEDAVRALAGAGGLDDAALAELLSWTGTAVGDVRMQFRGEVFVSRALRNPRIRGCPLCLRADAEGQEHRPARAMALRGDWQLRDVSLCVRHGHPLVTLWEEGTPARRYEVAARLDEVAERVLAGGFDAEPVAPSPYDLWLDARLEDGRDPTWLAGAVAVRRDDGLPPAGGGTAAALRRSGWRSRGAAPGRAGGGVCRRAGRSGGHRGRARPPRGACTRSRRPPRRRGSATPSWRSS